MLQIKPKNKDLGTEDREYKDTGVIFTLAPIDNRDYQVAIERARRLIARADAGQELNSISVSAADRTEHDIQCDLAGMHLVKGWRGDVFGADGEPIPYTPENASALLASNSELFTWVIATSAAISIDAQKEKEELLGKPSSASVGSEKTETAEKSSA